MKMFFSADQDIDLWPHFLKHYTSLGCTEFYCSTTNSPLKSCDNLKTVPHTRDESLTYFTSLQRAFFKMIEETPIGPEEWWMLAELDEFHEYDEPISEIIKNCNDTGRNVVMGTLIDRVAADGSLPELKKDVSLEEQFPSVSNITAEILKGCRDKIMLVKGRQQVNGGNHSMKNGCNPLGKWFKVYHFKWNSNVIKRMETRTAIGNDDEGNGWIQGNKRVLKHWAANCSVLI